MKNRVLAFLAVVLMIPLLSGCRINGLWGFDDHHSKDAGAISPGLPNRLVLRVQIPRSSLVAGIRGNLAPTDLSVTIADQVLDYASGAARGPSVSFTKTVDRGDPDPVINALFVRGNGALPLTVAIQGDRIAATVLEAAINSAGIGATATIEVSLQLEVNPDGSFGFSVIPISGVTNQPSPGTTATPALLISAIEYQMASGSFADLEEGHDVPAPSTTLRIIFNSEVASVTEEFQISATPDVGDPVHLISADIEDRLIRIATGTLARGGRSVSFLDMILAPGPADGKVLSPGRRYAMTFSFASAVVLESPTVRFPPGKGITRTFSTAVP